MFKIRSPQYRLNGYQYLQSVLCNQLALFLLIKMDKIVDKLYLGNLKGASDMQALHKAGITHILQVASGIRPFFPKDFKYKVINVTDTSQSSLIRHFPAAVQFIKEGISKGGVLVHCYAGVSRSASCVIAFLMQEKDMTFTEAFAFASKRRPIIFPNMGFQRQLCEYEKLLHLHKSYSSPARVNKLTAKVALGSGGNSSSSIQRLPANGGAASMNATVANFTGNQGLVGKGGANKEIVRQIHRSLLQGIPSTNNKQMFSADASAQDFLFDQEVPQNDEFQRVTYFDRSNAFGFSEDKLGRLAEINKNQLDSALRDLNSFRRTDQGFNRQPYVRGGVTNKGTNNMSKESFSRMSPQKRGENSNKHFPKQQHHAGTLRLEKQPVSAENMWETQIGKRTINDKMNSIRSPDGRIIVKNPEFNDYCQNEGHVMKQSNSQSGRPKTNQSARKPFGNPSGSFDNTNKNSHKMPDVNVYVPTMGTGPGSLLQVSSEDLHTRKLVRGMPDSPTVKKTMNQDLFNSINHNSNGKHLFVCVGCNTPLFTSKDLVDHTSTATTSSSTAHRAQLNKCNNYYVKQREWMNNMDGGQSSSNLKKTSGTLTCYRKVCKKKLGSYSMQGLRCNCGHFVKPAFQILKNRVKAVGNASSNINIISNHNHASNSDLSKYSTGVDPFHTQNTAPSVLHTPDIRYNAPAGESLTSQKYPNSSSSVVENGQNGNHGMYYSSMFKKSTDKLLNHPQGTIPIVHRQNNQGPVSGVTIGSQLSSKYQKRNAVDFMNNQFIPHNMQVTANALLSQDPFTNAKVFILSNGKGTVGRQQISQNSADHTLVNKNHLNANAMLKVGGDRNYDKNWNNKNGHQPAKSFQKSSNVHNGILINSNYNNNSQGRVLKAQNLSFAGQDNSHISENQAAHTAIYFNKGNQSSYSHNVSGAPTAEGTAIQIISGNPTYRSKGTGSVNVPSSSFSTTHYPPAPIVGRKSEIPSQRKTIDRKLKLK